MPTYSVVLTDQEARMISRLVRSGSYRNASEVLREGLRLLQRQEVDDKAKLMALRRAAAIGLEDFKAGRFVELKSPEDIQTYLDTLTDEVLARRSK